MLPIIRPRRTRKYHWLQDLVAETTLNTGDLIYPIFITKGSDIKEPIASMPNIYLYSIDQLLKEIERALNLGIRAVNLFPRINMELKSLDAKEAYNPDNLICSAVRAIKKTFSNEIGVFCDVALDPYTTHGHDGILDTKSNDVDNDITLEVLSKQALSLAHSGVDLISPSDMMDGRVLYIRSALDKQNFTNVGIMSYAAKYASKLYLPFRDAIGSKNSLLQGDKRTYQMDLRNHKEAMREISLDIHESADIILIKPAIYCLDIIFNAATNFNIPIFAYQVSGEYSMIANYSKELEIDFAPLMHEALSCIKRAGAKSIVSYGALMIASFLKTNPIK
jgi:porphobilinogen synthase